MSQKTHERPRHASLSCLEFIDETRKFYLRGTKKTEAQDHGSHSDTSAIQDADSDTNIVGKNPSTEETGSPSPSIGGHNQPTLEPRGGLGWGGRTPLSNEEEVSHALRAVDDCSDCVSSEAVGQTVATATSGLHQSRNLWNTGSLLRLDTPVRSLAYLTHRDGSGAHQGLTSWPFDSPDEARLMRYYITDISRRFDLCDPERAAAHVSSGARASRVGASSGFWRQWTSPLFARVEGLGRWTGCQTVSSLAALAGLASSGSLREGFQPRLPPQIPATKPGSG